MSWKRFDYKNDVLQVRKRFNSFLGTALSLWYNEPAPLPGRSDLSRIAAPLVPFGHRIVLMELFTGRLFVGVGIHAVKIIAPIEWQDEYPLRQDRSKVVPLAQIFWIMILRLRSLIKAVDPIILHAAPPARQ